MSDVTEKVSDTINVVVDKAREYGEIARLHALIKAEEAKKQEYYYKHAPASDLSEYMNKLIAADEKIADYREDLKVASSKEDPDSETEETEDDPDQSNITIE